jgi:hypothetical protein
MSAQQQLDFGDVPEIATRDDAYAGLRLSYSRRESLDQCTLRYFFQYYGNALHDPDLHARVQFLKGVKSRHLRTGELVHLVIGTYFKKLKQGKRVFADGLTKWARELFRQDQIYSAHIRNGGRAAGRPFPPAILDEILNMRIGHEGLLIQAEEQLLNSLEQFFKSSAFSEFRMLGASAGSCIERKFSLSGFPGPVSGKVDLAAKSEDGVTVVDWKIGSASAGGAESLQLGMYGMWAMTEFGVSAENLRIAKAHLASQEVVEFKAEQQAFENARVRILQDFERMVILHGYGRVGAIGAFTPNPQQGVCRLCPFREVCPEGEAVVDD